MHQTFIRTAATSISAGSWRTGLSEPAGLSQLHAWMSTSPIVSGMARTLALGALNTSLDPGPAEDLYSARAAPLSANRNSRGLGADLFSTLAFPAIAGLSSRAQKVACPATAHCPWLPPFSGVRHRAPVWGAFVDWHLEAPSLPPGLLGGPSPPPATTCGASRTRALQPRRPVDQHQFPGPLPESRQALARQPPIRQPLSLRAYEQQVSSKD